MLYGSHNALCVTGLIIDSVHCLTEKSTDFINWAQAAQLPKTCAVKDQMWCSAEKVFLAL